MDKRLNDIVLNPYFRLSEFQSPDTGEVKLSAELLNRLVILRMQIRVPIVITSGYRTEVHNRAVKGVKNSKHREGKAVDFTVNPLHVAVCMEFMSYVGWDFWYYNEEKHYFHAQVK